MGGPLIGLINGISTGSIEDIITYSALIVVILLIAFPLHELAHAVTADRLGDNTPRLAGRMTLNPFKHLSLIGSVLFLVAGFGFATTPVNPANFRGDWRLKHALVAVAGPIMNIVIAGVFALIFRVLTTVADADSGMLLTAARFVCVLAVQINLFLAFFNLIPIPPLDGSTIMLAFASDGLRNVVLQFGQYGWLILIVLSQAGILSMLINPPVRTLFTMLIPRF
jgi:Zn-dependent protease